MNTPKSGNRRGTRAMRAIFAASSAFAVAVAAFAAQQASGGGCGVVPAPAGTGTVTVNFANLNAAGSMDAAHTWVTFGGATTGLVGTINGGGGALVLGKSYKMSTLIAAGGVTLTYFNSGRIYLSYGAGITANAANCWSPNFANPQLVDYGTRWDKVELDWSGLAGGANLTSQDFFSIPLQVDTSGGGQTASTLTWWASTATVMNALGAFSSYSVNSVGNPQGAVVTGPNGVTIAGLPGSPVVRIINPSTVTGNTNGTTVYPTFGPYIRALMNSGGKPVATNIAGSNGTFGSGVQTYAYTVTIANKAGKIVATKIRPGDVVFDGTAWDGTKNTRSCFVIRSADFTDTNIYGAAAPYTMIVGTNVNAIVEKSRADYLAALNFGFPGSSEMNPMRPRATVGASPSWLWYGNPPSGLAGRKMPISYAFEVAQPTNTYYNQFANYLTGVTDAYGFAFNDRLQAPLASLGTGSAVTITVLTDAGGTQPPVMTSGPMDLVIQQGDTGAIESWDIDDFAFQGSAQPFDDLGAGEHASTVTDWNNDGHPDVIFENRHTGDITVRQCVRGQFFGEQVIETPSPGPGYRLVGSGDMDGDGHPDLVWLRNASETIEIWRMDGTELAEQFIPTGQSWRSTGGRASCIADWNDDGTDDLIVWHADAGQLEAFTLDGDRFIPLAQVDMPNSVTAANWRPVAIGDYDADGDHDVIFQRTSNGLLRAVVLAVNGAVEEVVTLPAPSGGGSARVRNSQ